MVLKFKYDHEFNSWLLLLNNSNLSPCIIARTHLCLYNSLLSLCLSSLWAAKTHAGLTNVCHLRHTPKRRSYEWCVAWWPDALNSTPLSWARGTAYVSYVNLTSTRACRTHPLIITGALSFAAATTASPNNPLRFAHPPTPKGCEKGARRHVAASAYSQEQRFLRFPTRREMCGKGKQETRAASYLQNEIVSMTLGDRFPADKAD